MFESEDRGWRGNTMLHGLMVSWFCGWTWTENPSDFHGLKVSGCDMLKLTPSHQWTRVGNAKRYLWPGIVEFLIAKICPQGKTEALLHWLCFLEAQAQKKESLFFSAMEQVERLVPSRPVVTARLRCRTRMERHLRWRMYRIKCELSKMPQKYLFKVTKIWRFFVQAVNLTEVTGSRFDHANHLPGPGGLLQIHVPWLSLIRNGWGFFWVSEKPKYPKVRCCTAAPHFLRYQMSTFDQTFQGVQISRIASEWCNNFQLRLHQVPQGFPLLFLPGKELQSSCYVHFCLLAIFMVDWHPQKPSVLLF